MEIFDKIAWQVDGGVEESVAIKHFEFMFNWLKDNNLLSKQGEEILSFGLDGSESLSENDVTSDGASFLKKYYDSYIGKIKYGMEENSELLDSMYREFLG